MIYMDLTNFWTNFIVNEIRWLELRAIALKWQGVKPLRLSGSRRVRNKRQGFAGGFGHQQGPKSVGETQAGDMVAVGNPFAYLLIGKVAFDMVILDRRLSRLRQDERPPVLAKRQAGDLVAISPA